MHFLVTGLTAGERKGILARDGTTCRECAARATEVDHILPRALGGGNEPFNLQSLCSACHKNKTVGRDNAHIHTRYANREDRYERIRNRQARAEQYEEHEAGECGYYCVYCSGEVQEWKKEDDIAERDERLEELPNCLQDGEQIYEDRIGVVLGYILYSPKSEAWFNRACHYMYTDAKKDMTRGEALMRRDVGKAALSAVIAYLQERGPQPRKTSDETYNSMLECFIDTAAVDLSTIVRKKVQEARRYYEGRSQQRLV